MHFSFLICKIKIIPISKGCCGPSVKQYMCSDLYSPWLALGSSLIKGRGCLPWV